MCENEISVLSKKTKLQQLEDISSGTTTSIDSSSLKSKIASFLVAYADKVMDTVGPLEQLRDILAEEYISKAQEALDNPEITPTGIANMITQIQDMNNYSLNTLRTLISADKLQTFISIDASDNSSSNYNVLNLDSAQSRARVLKAVSALDRIANNSNEIISASITSEEGE